MVLFLQLKLVSVELCSLGDDTPSGIVSEHGRLSVKIHRPVHFSHCDVKINLCLKQGGRGGEREKGGRGKESVISHNFHLLVHIHVAILTLS